MIPIFSRSARLALPGLGAVCGLAACQTAPRPDSGFLSDYTRLEVVEGTVRASIRQHRDEASAAQIERVWLEPSVLAGPATTAALTAEERALVRRVLGRT